MNKIVISCGVVVLMLLLSMIGCQNEENELQQSDKVDILKAKSKELAKKYNVDVVVNDDSIAKYANQMTIQGMEDDYKAFAEMKKSLQQSSYFVESTSSMKKVTKKSFIRRRKAEVETPSNPLENQSEDFQLVVDTEMKCRGNRCFNDAHLSFAGDYHWEFNAYTKDITCRASISSICKHEYCPGNKCHGCSPNNTESLSLTVSGINLDGDISFTATGSFYCNVCAYSILVGVRLEHSVFGNQVSFS